jgi:hypothetical protein
MSDTGLGLPLAAALALAAAAGVWAQPVGGPDRVLVRTWLLTDCGLGDSKLEQQILSRGTVLEPLFLEALDKGPPPDELQSVEKVARERFDKMRRSLDDPNRRLEMRDADREAMRQTTLESFVSAERDNLVLRWRTQAVNGLALVGTDKARQALRALERDKSSPLRDNAVAALKRLSTRK